MPNRIKSATTEFHPEESYKPRNEKEKRLIRAFMKLGNEGEVAAFLRDLMTIAEIEEFSNRLEIARMLLEGKSYLDISQKTKVSTTTVTRVAHWLFHGCGGYRKVLKEIK